MISLSSMLWVPGYFIYYFLSTPGTWREVLAKGVTPVIKPRPEAIKAEAKYNEALMAAKSAEARDVEMLLVAPEPGTGLELDGDQVLTYTDTEQQS